MGPPAWAVAIDATKIERSATETKSKRRTATSGGLVGLVGHALVGDLEARGRLLDRELREPLRALLEPDDVAAHGVVPGAVAVGLLDSLGREGAVVLVQVALAELPRCADRQPRERRSRRR